MIVEVEGWARNHGSTVLANKPITKASIADTTHPLRHDEVRAVAFDYLDFQNLWNGKPTASNFEMLGDQLTSCGVTVVTGVPNIALNGRYQITLKFSAQELLTMAAEATKGWPVDYLLKQLAALQKADNGGEDG